MKKLIREITDLNFTLSDVNRAIVTAVGDVPTTGWTSPELIDSPDKSPSNDIVHFDFVAEESTGLTGQMITPITTNRTVVLMGQEVMVRSESNEKAIRLPAAGDSR